MVKIQSTVKNYFKNKIKKQEQQVGKKHQG